MKYIPLLNLDIKHNLNQSETFPYQIGEPYGENHYGFPVKAMCRTRRIKQLIAVFGFL